MLYQLECIVPPYFDDVLTMQFRAFTIPNYTVKDAYLIHID